MKRFLIVLAILAATTGPAIAVQDPQHLFSEGNQFYEKGDWDSAIGRYQDLVNQGFGNARLYYNIGNAYFRKGDRGNAVLWFERALRFAPRDNDLQFNLALARSHLKDAQDPLWKRAVFLFSSGEIAITTLLLCWVFFGLLTARYLGWAGQRQSTTIMALWCSGLLLTFSAIWCTAHAVAFSAAEAIVIEPPGEVRNGPGEEYAVGFTIPEGSKVLVVEQRPQWLQVGVPQQGLKGWMPSAQVELISTGR